MTFLLPRSLRARLILLILGSVLVAQVATVVAIEHYRRNFLDNVAPDLMATTIRTLRAAIAQIDEKDRAAFVATSSGGEWRLVSRPAPHRGGARRGEGRPPRERPPHPRIEPLPGGVWPPDFRADEFRFPAERRPPLLRASCRAGTTTTRATKCAT